MTNDGWSFVALTDEELAAADEETAIRSFRIETKAQKVGSLDCLCWCNERAAALFLPFLVYADELMYACA